MGIGERQYRQSTDDGQGAAFGAAALGLEFVVGCEERTVPGKQAVGQQEQCAAQREVMRQGRRAAEQLCHAGHADGDQQRVADDAPDHAGADMLTLHRLSQNIEILRADGDDE